MRKTYLAVALLTLILGLEAQTGAQIAPLVTPRKQFRAADGAPLAGGKIYTYRVGTTTPQDTFTDSTGATPNSNPVILDAGGFASIYIGCTQQPFKIVVKDVNEVLQWTQDGIHYPGCPSSPSVFPGEILNTMKNRWASLIMPCTAPIAGTAREAVFSDWAEAALTTRTCNDADYLFPYATYTTSTAASSHHDQVTDDISYPLGADVLFRTRTSVSDRATGARRWIGWTDVGTLGMVSTDNPTPPAQVIAFWSCPFLTIAGCNPDGGANQIYCVTKDGTTITRQNTGVNFVASQIYYFEILWKASTRTATFKMGGTTVCTMNTNMPANSVRMRVHNSVTNTSGGQDYSMRSYGINVYYPIP